MSKSDILMHQSCKKEVNLSHQCKTENGIEPDEKFIIVDIIDNFEQLKIKNQYNQEFIINPNQLI